MGTKNEIIPQKGARPIGSDFPSLAGDLIWGVEAIAKEIGKTSRQAFHLVETKQLPAGKIGGRIVASRAKLRAHFEAIVAGGEAEVPATSKTGAA